MKCTDLLMQDHKVILRCLDVLEHMAKKVNHGDAVEPEDVETVLRFLRVFADEHHQAKEEGALFPELRRAAQTQARSIEGILFEHDQERSLVGGLEDALHTSNGPDFVHFAYRLTGLLRTHIYKEDNILFDIVESCLSMEQDEKVAADFGRFKTDSGFLADLRRLEWKYLRRAA